MPPADIWKSASKPVENVLGKPHVTGLKVEFGNKVMVWYKV